MYSYQNFKPGVVWHGTAIVRFRVLRSNIAYYRNQRGFLLWPNACVHCTYCFATIADLITKLKTFAHSERNVEPYINASFLAACILCRRDFLDWEPLVPYNQAERFQPLDHPQLAFLRQACPMSDLSSARKNVVLDWMRQMKCRAVVDFEKYGIRDDKT
jgi:hypothetical protein